MSVQIVTAAVDHIAAIAVDARPADVAELWAAERLTPAGAMADGIRDSALCWTALLDGMPVCMFGVAAGDGGCGTPWFIGAAAMDGMTAKKHLLRLSRDAVAQMQARFPALLNVVDDRNDAAKRWLAWLGFSLGEPIAYGPDALAFRAFWKGVPHAHE